MRVVLFVHSVVSDWNNGNAHFLRGVAAELARQQHDVRIFEPVDGWSFTCLSQDHGLGPAAQFRKAYRALRPSFYTLDRLSLDDALAGADLVLVHEWNDPELVRRIGEHRRSRGRYVLFFHDTHHRAVSDEAAMTKFDLRYYDAVLAFGQVLEDVYVQKRWASRVFTWHEAADTRLFYPRPEATPSRDLVWIGNFGDDERTRELEEFLIEPVRRLGLRASVYGVRYPESALRALDRAGIEYCGYLPNFRVPEIFGSFKVTLHVPRRWYARELPGIPTIRPFEALACGIPLISAPWRDTERLFEAGRDYVMVDDGAAMERALSRVLSEPSHAESLRRHGLRTVQERHTCAHRVLELLRIARSVVASRPQFEARGVEA